MVVVVWRFLDYFVLVLFAFDVLDLVSSVPCQETGYEECLRNDLFCVSGTYNLNSINSSILLQYKQLTCNSASGRAKINKQNGCTFPVTSATANKNLEMKSKITENTEKYTTGHFIYINYVQI